MKWKFIVISMVIALSAVLVFGCSNTQSSSKPNQAQTKQTGQKQKAKQQKKKKGITRSLVNFLDMTRKDFNAERKNGKSIVEIAQEKNKTEQQVIDYLLQKREASFKKSHPNATQDVLNQKKQAWTKAITKQIENKKGA
ncbi:hypothetical protein ACQYAD_08865 [Neobacillus sp. SM06]|uniref:hypothetical protein n=1 Tax=Neobacillus sp. SM06 TaxID=3422492 RepID=UPI003D28DDF4